MDVGHRQRCFDDAGQVRDVGHLLERGVLTDVLHHGLVGVDDSLDAHLAFAGNAPPPFIDSFHPHRVLTNGPGAGDPAQMSKTTLARQSPSRCSTCRPWYVTPLIRTRTGCRLGSW